MAYAEACMAGYYNTKHTPVKLRDQVYLQLVCKPSHTGYHLPKSLVFSPVKLSPFLIKQQIGPLAYKLDLLASLGIHPVVSVIHLEQAHDRGCTPNINLPDPLIPVLPSDIHTILDKQLLPISSNNPHKI